MRNNKEYETQTLNEARNTRYGPFEDLKNICYLLAKQAIQIVRDKHLRDGHIVMLASCKELGFPSIQVPFDVTRLNTLMSVHNEDELRAMIEEDMSKLEFYLSA